MADEMLYRKTPQGLWEVREGTEMKFMALFVQRSDAIAYIANMRYKKKVFAYNAPLRPIYNIGIETDGLMF